MDGSGVGRLATSEVHWIAATYIGVVDGYLGRQKVSRGLHGKRLGGKRHRRASITGLLERFQAPKRLTLADASERRNLLALRRPRNCLTGFPVIDGLSASAQKLSKVASG